METGDLKKTPLCEEHVKCNAKMVPFGGWYMPIQYTSIVAEHMHVRTQCGLFDVSHMGEIRVTGNDTLAYLEQLLPRNIGKIKQNQAAYTPMCYGNGTIVDDLLVYHVSENNYLIVVNAANIEKDFAWMQQQTQHFSVTLENESSQTAQIAVQGPKAVEVVQALTDVDLSSIKNYWFANGSVAGITCIISRTGYTGEDGFELYCAAEHAPQLWNALLENEIVQPIGLGARDTLRLECCMMLYGNDIDDTTTPLEAPLRWTLTGLKNDKQFIGRAALEQAAINKKLVALEVVGRGIARHGYPLCTQEGKEIGTVTSGTMSPLLKKAIALGYVTSECAEEGKSVFVKIRDALVEARIVPMPFYKREK